MILNDFIKQRGCAECLRTSLRFFGNNIATIIRATWLSVTLLSLCVGIFSFCQIAMHTDINQAPSMLSILMSFVQAIVATLIGALCIARFVSIINGDSLKANYIRCLSTTGLWVLLAFGYAIGLVLTSILPTLMSTSTPTPHTIKMQIIAFAIYNIIIIPIVLVFLVQPFVYTSTKYMLEPASHLGTLVGHNWLVGFRHKWFLFKGLLIISALYLVVFLVCSMPMIVINISMWSNSMGMQWGDADGLPSYFPYIAFLAMTLQTFFFNYVAQFCFTYLTCLYGSIEAKERLKCSLA